MSNTKAFLSLAMDYKTEGRTLRKPLVMLSDCLTSFWIKLAIVTSWCIIAAMYPGNNDLSLIYVHCSSPSSIVLSLSALLTDSH